MTHSLLRQNHWPVFRHRDTMLKVSTETSVCRDGRPFIAQHSRLGLAIIHHRLNCDHHSLSQFCSMPTRTKIRNLRLFVQPCPNAVSHKLTHHAEPGSFHVLLHRSANISNRVPDPSLLDAPVQRCFC